MNKKLHPILMALALAGPIATATAQSPNASQPTTTSAQESSERATPRSTSERNAMQAGAEANKEQLKVSDSDLQNEVTDANKASKIIGKEVRNTQNEKIGKVKDLVVDTRSGRIAYAVLSTGGMFGDGKLIAVPLDALSLKPGEKHFLIEAAKDRLAAAPGFSEDNWPKLNASEGDKTIGLSAGTDESTRQKATEDQDKNREREDSDDDKPADPNRPRENRP